MRTLLCFGDSNTHGSPPMATLQSTGRMGPSERWPGVCRAALGPGWQVVEEGLPGRTAARDDPLDGPAYNGLAALPMLLHSHAPVDAVAILLGTNELKARTPGSAEDIALGIELLVMAAKASARGPGQTAPAVLLIAPPPILEAGCLAEMYAGGAAKSARLGALYAAVAERQGVAFLDAGTLISSNPVDGVHFDPPAHAVLGRAVAGRVQAMFA